MEHLTFIAVVANVFLTAICAFCLVVGVGMNRPTTDETGRLLSATRIALRYFITIGGSAFILFVLFIASVRP